MIIDVHAHILPPQIKKDRGPYIDRDPCFAILYSDKKARIATAEDLIASMDANGVDISVAVNYGWTTHELCVETNDYILESVARYPDRLVGFCAVQPNSYDAALAELERCAGAGARGVGELRPDLQLFDPGDESFMAPFAELMTVRNLVLMLHASEPVGHLYPGKGTVTPELLYPLFTAFPELTVICAHWGGGLPFYTLMPEVKKALANVYFDSAASPFLYTPEVYLRVAELAGADKILFGTDYPLLEPGRLLKEIEAADMPVETCEQLLAGNARRLLGLD
jgi:predicted TIM-barrel fold metal-dependent hydrolase